MGVFSWFRLPNEILMDQGSNVTSQLMKEVCDLLKVRKLQTTPYHPQANGLVERFNGCLKHMLRTFCGI